MKEINREEAGSNQVHEIRKEEEGEEAILELIGDIADYRPGGKIVIFEGENSEFDMRMTGRLFPRHERKMNFVSGGNKSTVRRLHQALEVREGQKGVGRIFSIVDRDDVPGDIEGEELGRFTWDVYHIENYLLDENVILEVLQKSSISETGFAKSDEVERELKEIALEQIEELVEHAVRDRVRQAVSTAIKLKGERKKGEGTGEGVSRRVMEAISRLVEQSKTEQSREELDKIADARRTTLQTAIKENRWKREFRGRDILRVFAGRYGGMRYETMRNMIINIVADQDIRPPGMLRVLERIDKWGRSTT